MQIADLPIINACLNFLATLFIIAGGVAIKTKREELHKKLMISALTVSALFLVCYLTYHFHFPTKKFPDLGLIKTLYYVILFPHIFLAAVMVPFIIVTVLHAIKGRLDKHKKIAKVTYVMWLYVSITGVLIYFMLYQWFA